MSFIVAIDGPAGTGKGTVAELIAKEMHLVKIDTGATYRCIALAAIKEGIGIEEKERLVELADRIKIDIQQENGIQKVLLNEEDVTKEIRSKEVTAIVSQISSIVEIRLKMVDLQRKMAAGKDVIMEGRDITTYVFPKADVKIYLDADEKERARRRYKENQEKGIDMTFDEVLENIRLRDKNDKEKEIGALKIASDAKVIDTTNLSISQMKRAVKKEIEKKKQEIAYKKKVYSIRPDTKWKLFEQKVIKAFLGGVYRLVYRVKIVGNQNVAEEGAFIICANHINYLDAAAIVLFTKRKVNFIAKEDLFNHRILNWLAHVFDIIPINRGTQDLESMKRSIKTLNAGGILGIFPEGTRKGIAKGGKAKTGAAYMAIRTGTPVIPVGIAGSFKPFTKVVMQYGKPMDFGEYQSKTPEKETLEKVSNEIMNQIIMLTNQEV
ncbi:MAG: (d)CMP kinase [Clostridia bacterium]